MSRLAKLLVVIAAGFLLAIINVSSAAAQGYGVYEYGTCQMGRGGAGVASPCDDGSAMFYNPAGLMLDVRPVISGGVTGIAPRGNFTDSGTGLVSTMNSKTYPAPSVYAAVPLGRRVVVGGGLFAPYGLTSDWPPNTAGRYLGYYTSLKAIYVQPTIAAKLNDNVMIGAGIDITHVTADIRQKVDLSTTRIPGTALTFRALGVPVGTDFADVKITGNANHIGAHFGLIIKANDRFSIGARYMTGQSVAVDGATFAANQIATGLRTPIPLGPTIPAGTPIDAIVAGAFGTGGSLSAQAASTSVPLPDQFVAGIAINATPSLKLLADYQWVHWKKFDQLAITTQYGGTSLTPENYGDTSGFRFGVEHTGAMAILRGGIDAHTAAAPDETVTPRLPEAPRFEVMVGAGFPAKSPIRLDLAYMYLHQSDRAGRTGDLPNNGTYHYYANLFAASLVVHF